MKHIAPIETVWRGYHFRSRTEARWAVLFTAARWPFVYEPEGFSLPSGCYLPDFWLPRQKFWFEVKGARPTEREWRLAEDLQDETGFKVAIGIGPPDPDDERQVRLVPDNGYDPYNDIVRMVPRTAYDAARAERFDGRPIYKPPTSRVSRWW